MKTLTTWVKHHSETISLLLVVGLGMLGGLMLALVFIAVASVLHVL
jgi:hypothetical protein